MGLSSRRQVCATDAGGARGASVVAILSLALGISVVTTIFSWVRGVC
jgi:hypothetical protein